MAILTYNHYINEANSFIADIRNNRNGYYMFTARSQPWSNSSGQNDDTAVLTTNNSVAQIELSVYGDLLYGKLLVDTDVSHVIPRYNWVANTVYDSYNQLDPDLFSKQFYVITDKYEVYKCIYNNNGANSIVKPTLTSPSGTFVTGDGYTWKYMFTVDSFSNTKFTTANYIPVTPNIQVQGNATPGSIDVIKITDGGSGYFVYETGYIGGVVDKNVIQLPPSASSTDEYYTNSSIYLKSGYGAGQIREISSSNGISKQVRVDIPFDTFVRLDLANIVGSVAKGYYVEQQYDVISYLYAQGYYNLGATVTQSDTGVSGKLLASNASVIQVGRFEDTLFSLNLPIVDVSQAGTQKTGNVSVSNTGACNLAFVTAGGTGYASNATVTITKAGATGAGAVANAQSNSSGKIQLINIETTGDSYFIAPTLSISAPTAQTFNSNAAVTGGTGSGSNNVINLTRLRDIVLSGATASGYNNADIITVESPGANAAVTFTTNATGGDLIFAITNTGSGFASIGNVPVSNIAITNSSGGAATGNSVVTYLLANVSSVTEFFVINDMVTYTVSAGNTAVGGLSSGTTYYVDFANTTVIALKSSVAGSRIALTKGATQTGHVLQGKTAEAVMYCDNQVVYGYSTQLNDSANGYTNGEYIRIGANTVSNIRRVANVVNTTALIVTSPFSTSYLASNNSHFKMTSVAEPVGTPVSNRARGYVSNTNLASIQLAIANSSKTGVFFIVGEKVNMTDSVDVNQGANAIIAFANSSTAVLSAVTGTWLANSGGIQFYMSGESSLQRSQISSVQSNPNITITDPIDTFKLGYPLKFKTEIASGSSGNATVISIASLPNDQTEYQIGPTVRVTGDGSNCIAIAIVNAAPNSPLDIIGVDVINPGTGYTQANVLIYANTNYDSMATAAALISPVRGHGSDSVTELGGRYVGVNVVLDEIANEGYDFLGYGSYRKVGILENPQFKDIKVTLTDFDRINLSLGTGSAGGWVPGEVVVQSVSNAAGVVVGGNSTLVQLKSVKGTFNSTNSIYGYYSANSGNVIASNTIYFPVGNAAQIITQSNSGSTGVITSIVPGTNNTAYMMSNVVGQFATGDVMFDSVVNAYATVSTIYTANGMREVSSSFGNRFNQTARITLTNSTGVFVENEYVLQDVSLATGKVVSSTNELDLVITSPSGTFTVGQTITDTTSDANGTCTFANSTYIKLMSVSQGLQFANTHSINNGLGSTATITNALPVLVLNDVSDVTSFQAGANSIMGLTSGASGTCNNALLLEQPDLVRDSGRVIYTESFAPVTRSATTKEEIKLVIKF